MVIDTVKENLNINKLVATKREVITVEGDMIVPDSKPDILNTISTSGVICIYKKEVLEGKVRLDGNINTYIMYMADDEKDKVRGLSTSLDFSENIQVSNCQEGMTCKIEATLKTIESKVINGRKVGAKATIEIELKVYSNEEVGLVNDIQNCENIQILKKQLKVNSLVGTGETKIYAKDTISIDSQDNLAEILKANLNMCDKDIKISYNKILTKSEAEVKIMYLTEDNRINTVTCKIPVVGFIDIPNVTEENICDVDYEIRNIVIKPNAIEEHSIYIEIEIGVIAIVYEEKEINLIQDLYSPIENLELNKRKITTMTKKTRVSQTKQIREKVMIGNLDGRRIMDVDVMPTIVKEHPGSSRVVYEGELELTFVVFGNDLNVETRMAKIPFDYAIDNIETSDNLNTNMTVEVVSKDFIVQDDGAVIANVDLRFDADTSKNVNLELIGEVQTNGEREAEDYSILMYIVKKDDTLWKIAKRFGSTVEDIARTNGIEDENQISPGQKIFIPHYTKVAVYQNA